MGLMKELNDLNNIYQNMYAEDENKGYVVTNADKKGNTPAYQAYKAGKKKKDGKPMYRAADHLKNESVGSAVDKTLSAVGDVAKVGAKAAVGTAKGAAGAVKVASKVVKGVGKAAGRVVGTPVGAVKAIKKGYKSAANDESFEFSPEVEKLIESGKFTMEEIAKISGVEIDEAQTAYEKARKAAARRAADRNSARKRGEMGGRMERETYTNEAGKEMHYKGYSA
jgi:hypothetical protein